MSRILRTHTEQRAESCATCTHWRVEGRPRPQAWCPKAAAWLPNDLTRCSCLFYARELVETQAREVYAQLVNRDA